MVLQYGRGGRLVVEYGYPDESLGSLRHVRRLQLGSQLSLPLVPPVLEPDLDLGLCQVQGRRQPRPLRARQVPLHVERRLQLEHLTPGEHRPRLLLPLVQEPSVLLVVLAVQVVLSVVVVVLHHHVVLVPPLHVPQALVPGGGQLQVRVVLVQEAGAQQGAEVVVAQRRSRWTHLLAQGRGRAVPVGVGVRGVSVVSRVDGGGSGRGPRTGAVRGAGSARLLIRGRRSSCTETNFFG